MTKFGKIVLSFLIMGGIFAIPAADLQAENGFIIENEASVESGIIIEHQITIENNPTITHTTTVKYEMPEVGWTKAKLQALYFEKIALEGFRPEIDRDGDIQFRVLGSNYFIRIS
jgi:hypothetical protein